MRIKTDFAHQITQDLSKIAAKFLMALPSCKLTKAFRSTEIARNLKSIIKISSLIYGFKQVWIAILTLFQIVSWLRAWLELKHRELRGWPFKASLFLECQLRTSMSRKANLLLRRFCQSSMEHSDQPPGSKIMKIVVHHSQVIFKRTSIDSTTLSHLPKSSPFSYSRILILLGKTQTI